MLIPAKGWLRRTAYVFVDSLPSGVETARYRLQAVFLDGSKRFLATATAER